MYGYRAGSKDNFKTGDLVRHDISLVYHVSVIYVAELYHRRVVLYNKIVIKF